jgi:hypothetical protein
MMASLLNFLRRIADERTERGNGGDEGKSKVLET